MQGSWSSSSPPQHQAWGSGLTPVATKYSTAAATSMTSAYFWCMSNRFIQCDAWLRHELVGQGPDLRRQVFDRTIAPIALVAPTEPVARAMGADSPSPRLQSMQNSRSDPSPPTSALTSALEQADACGH